MGSWVPFEGPWVHPREHNLVSHLITKATEVSTTAGFRNLTYTL
jgi:hypothetical protein